MEDEVCHAPPFDIGRFLNKELLVFIQTSIETIGFR